MPIIIFAEGLHLHSSVDDEPGLLQLGKHGTSIQSGEPSDVARLGSRPTQGTIEDIGLLPDYVFALQFPDGKRRAFLVECDRGTMPVERSTLDHPSFFLQAPCMSVIRKIEVNSFRSLKKFQWQPSEGLNCLIGPGDSGSASSIGTVARYGYLTRLLRLFHLCEDLRIRHGQAPVEILYDNMKTVGIERNAYGRGEGMDTLTCQRPR